jgi:hypothetical protein
MMFFPFGGGTRCHVLFFRRVVCSLFIVETYLSSFRASATEDGSPAAEVPNIHQRTVLSE